MFDKLIESDTAGAEFKSRSRYFTVSTIIVGILFLTAVVYSLYAAEVGLGNVSFDISELVAPLETNEPEPEPEPDREQQVTAETADKSMRRVIMASTSVPTIAPIKTSSERNPFISTDPKRFNNMPVGPRDVVGSGNRLPGGPGGGSSASSGVDSDDIDGDTVKTEPPPVITKRPPTIVRTSKILNGSAISLPKPAYPKPAQMLNLEGSVNVQVTIDENGNVVSAKAADGHPFFRGVAEQAARGAKFRPTILNDNPIKVTGIIVYRFKRS